MDPRLAEIYGTNENAESDVEKTVAAELAEKFAGENETDIDGMSDEEIEVLAKEVLSADEEKTEDETTEEPAAEKVAEDKVAVADYLGRVMAHSYVQELKSIEKEASAEKTAGKGKLMKHKGKMKMSAAEEKEEKEEKKEEKGEKKLPPFMKKKDGDKEKKSSALDTLAVQRAKEILSENGFEEVKAEGEEKKASTKAELLGQAVEARAIEILKAEGYKFEEEKTETEE